MKYLILFIICIVVLAAASPIYSLMTFEEFKNTYNKHYLDDTELEYRRSIFMDKLEKIKIHNEKYDKGEVTYTIGVNKFSDLLPEEVPKGLLPLQTRENMENKFTFHYDSSIPLEAEIDWRKKGAVTPVKDQGNCGSCWAFSTTGTVEGAWFLKTGKLVSVSEQNLVDCSGDYFNFGCKGGDSGRALEYIIDNNGINTEKSYPYEAIDGDCRYNSSNPIVTISASIQVEQDNELALQQAVATMGPISVAIDASGPFVDYNSTAVYYNPSCCELGINHEVLVVGYGTQDGQDYWLVKNSWSADWGDHGYIKMARNKDNNCAIATNAWYSVI